MRVSRPSISISLSFILVLSFLYSLTLSSDQIANWLLSVDNVRTGRIWVLFTAGFLHANLLHLFGNVFALLVFGRVVEKEVSPSTTLMLYFGALLVSSVISLTSKWVLGSSVPSIGASGAIAGMIGAAILLRPFAGLFRLLPIPVFVFGWFFLFSDISGLLGPSDGIDHVAHLGGFFSVALLMYFIGSAERGKLKKGFVINCALLISLLLVWLFLF